MGYRPIEKLSLFSSLLIIAMVLMSVLQHSDRILAINANDVDTLNNKGIALGRSANYTGAIKYFDKVLTINASDVRALNDKGLALDGLGNYTGAIKYYDKALAIDPNYVKALNNKGIALTKLAEKNNNTTSSIPFLTYQNSTLGIRMQYPYYWQKEGHGLLPSDPGVTFRSPVDRSSHSYPVVIYIQIEPSGGKTLDKYTFEQINSLRQQSDNILNTSTIFLPGNNSANRIEYTGEALGIRTQEMQVYTIKDDQAYTIWYLAQPTTYTKYLPAVQKMIESFELTESNKEWKSNQNIPEFHS